ncbi:MAG: ABC transporter ATP-binding protein [Atopobiaceae bacterium]|nr:ABC transporter ATP-binding protein [Atopobiaceae bacterium]
MILWLRRIMRFCGSYAKRIRIAWVFAFLKAFCANVPYMVAIVLIGELLNGTLQPRQCIAAAVAMLALLACQSVFQNIADRLQSSAGYELFADVRLRMAEHLRRLPMGYFDEGNMGKISSVLSNDMVFVEEHSMQVLAESISDIFSEALLVAFLFSLHPLVGALGLATVLAAVGVAQLMHRETAIDSDRRQQSIEDLTSAILEYTEGIGVIKSFNRTSDGAAELWQAFSDMTESNLAFERNHSPWERRLNIVYGLGMAAIVAASVGLFERGSLQPAMFIGVMLFAFNLFGPLKHLYGFSSQISIMTTALNRLETVLSEQQIADSGTRGLPAVTSGCPAIEFRNVRFGYGDDEVLHGVSFTAGEGQTVALVGQSGSGKTTIANLLARFWDVRDGDILLHGVSVRDLPLEVLMSQLSVVFQRVYLFEDTVFNNIAFGRADATMEEVEEAARRAQCYDFIQRLPYGFNTVIGEGGASLSGGEAQRISIARCILKDAPIVILDEATANLDADNESAIQEAMTELCRDKTTLVIAHKLGTIRTADKIVVLESGTVAEVGTHEELLGAQGVYARMVAALAARTVWSEEGAA